MAALGVAASLRPQEGPRSAPPARGRAVEPRAPSLASPPAPSLPITVSAPEPGSALLRGGLEAARAGDLEEAASLLARAVERDPGDADAWNVLGVVLVRRGEAVQGVEAFRRALRARPGHPEAHRNLAVTLDRQGRTREAARHYRAFLSQSLPSDPRYQAVSRRLDELQPSRRNGE